MCPASFLLATFLFWSLYCNMWKHFRCCGCSSGISQILGEGIAGNNLILLKRLCATHIAWPKIKRNVRHLVNPYGFVILKRHGEIAVMRFPSRVVDCRQTCGFTIEGGCGVRHSWYCLHGAMADKWQSCTRFLKTFPIAKDDSICPFLACETI